MRKFCQKELVNLNDLYLAEAQANHSLLLKMDREESLLTPAEKEIGTKIQNAIRRLHFEAFRVDYICLALTGFCLPK